MTEHDGVLYLVSTDEVFASTDDGETWNVFCDRPEGDAIGFVIADAAQQAGRTMYLALQDKGVFRSTDAGEQWTRLNDGLIGRTVSTMAAIGTRCLLGQTGVSTALMRVFGNDRLRMCRDLFIH